MTSTQTGKEGAVSAAVDALSKAIMAADKSALDKIAAAELSYGHSSGRTENKAEFIDAIVSGKSGFADIKLEGQTVNVVDKIAIVRHMFHATQKKSGEKVKLFNLTIWMQQQDQWKLLARQAAKL
jgi:ketosteroid isomerase-like protein